MENFSYENEPAGRTHFRMNGFALELTETQKASRNWPIKLDSSLVRFYSRVQANCGSLVDSRAVSTVLILTIESWVNVSVLENLYVLHCFFFHNRFPPAVV